MKSTPRRIVCATDFSLNARHAADVAAAIALRLRATLILVHVTDEAGAHQEESKELRALLRQSKTQLRRETRRVRQSGAVISEVLLHGNWAEAAITAFVEKNPPALVVVSSVSKTAFDRWTLGSVSERISQQAPVPTLVVRAPERLLAWARQKLRLNVVVAVDFTASCDAALSWINELRAIGSCAVTAAYICGPRDKRLGQAVGGEMSSSRMSAPELRKLARELERKVSARSEGNVAIRVEPDTGSPDVTLVELAGEWDADLVVVGTHQWHGLKRVSHRSISRGVLRHAPMNVACVPAARAVAHGRGGRAHIRRVLVATDLSPMGDRAIPWAFATLEPGGVVKLVHVLSPWAAPGAFFPRPNSRRSSRDAHERRVNAAREKLRTLVPPEASTNGIATEVEVIEDRDPARAIGVAAQRFGADLVCLSSRGRTTVAETLRGSVARAVVAQNLQPVLLVQPAPP